VFVGQLVQDVAEDLDLRGLLALKIFKQEL
jgi:hypothetical protein